MIVKPYGDTLNDGFVQISFTLPLPLEEKAKAAAIQVALQMECVDPQIVHAETIGENFSFFVIYGKAKAAVSLDTLKVIEKPSNRLSQAEIENHIKEHFDRDLIVIGASTGTDAHTVGIDAIMNMKGYDGHFGLERYAGIRALNLGSQIPNETLIQIAREEKADVILVSQTVTQKDVHLKNLIELVELLEIEKLRDQILLIVGGARITHSLAKELGYDAGFGPETYAEDVATFIVQNLKLEK